MARVGFCMQDHQDFENKDKDKETEMRGGQTVRIQMLCWSMITISLALQSSRTMPWPVNWP